MQVKPGLVSSRRRCHSLHLASSLQGSGRGPTMAMSPTSTFQSCGNSSSPVLRSTLPSRVTRGSFVILKAGPSRSFNCCSFPLRSSASTTIVRNLYMAKTLPNCPVRNCRKKTGPLDVSLMAIAAIKINGNATARPIKAPLISMQRFQSG